MKIEIVEINRDNIEAVAREFDVTDCPYNKYRQSVNVPWINLDYPIALAIAVEKKFVGWIQTIFANRIVDGKETVVCNLSSWYVMEEHRHLSMHLMLRIKKYSKSNAVTIFTPSGIASRIYEAMEVPVLDRKRLELPISDVTSDTTFESIHLGNIDMLPPDDRKTFSDHVDFGCKASVIEDGTKQCSIFYRVREHRGRKVADVLSASGNVELLLNSFSIGDESSLEAVECFLIDNRMVNDKLRQNALENNPITPRYIMSDEKNIPKNLDFMYSEIILSNSSLL